MPLYLLTLSWKPQYDTAWIMGRDFQGVSDLEQAILLEITGESIISMYNKCLNSRANEDEVKL